jgi:glutamine amidotransferase
VSVVIIDNGGGNVASICHALARLGATAELTTDAERIRMAERVILPGVGAAADAMARLRACALENLLPTLRQPVLGICLGMQLLHQHSDEGGVDCLGLLPGDIRRLQPTGDLPVPHMGWNRLVIDRPHPLLAGLDDGTFVYFVHSYALRPDAETYAHTEYGGQVAAVVSRNNFHGVQFHPERSGASGARLLANFLALGA